MAGSILISTGCGVALNSFGFDLIVSSIRKKLEVSSPEIIDSIFHPLDVGCMPFISVKSADEKAFLHFYDAAKSGFSEWSDKNKDAFPEWQELIEKLESDVRFSPRN